MCAPPLFYGCLTTIGVLQYHPQTNNCVHHLYLWVQHYQYRYNSIIHRQNNCVHHLYLWVQTSVCITSTYGCNTTNKGNTVSFTDKQLCASPQLMDATQPIRVIQYHSQTYNCVHHLDLWMQHYPKG